MVCDADGDPVVRRHGAHETVIADLVQPESLRMAAMGIDAVLQPEPLRLHDGKRRWPWGAKTVGVARFVFSRVYRPSLSALSNHQAPVLRRNCCQ
jgi:hypothetical protein